MLQRSGDRFDPKMRNHFPQSLGEQTCLRLADIGGTRPLPAIEIGGLQGIAINQRQLPDADSRERLRHDRSQSAAADHRQVHRTQSSLMIGGNESSMARNTILRKRTRLIRAKRHPTSTD